MIKKNGFALLTIALIIAMFGISITSVSALSYCNGACTSNYDCATDYVCLSGVCRGSCSPTDATCGCVASATPAPTSIPQSTPRSVPVTGTSWATFVMFGAGLLVVVGSFFSFIKK
jgi:hypothetical protein